MKANEARQECHCNILTRWLDQQSMSFTGLLFIRVPTLMIHRAWQACQCRYERLIGCSSDLTVQPLQNYLSGAK